MQSTLQQADLTYFGPICGTSSLNWLCRNNQTQTVFQNTSSYTQNLQINSRNSTLVTVTHSYPIIRDPSNGEG